MNYDPNFEKFYDDLIKNGTNEELRRDAIKSERKGLLKSILIVALLVLIIVVIFAVYPFLLLKLFPRLSPTSRFYEIALGIPICILTVVWLELETKNKRRRKNPNPYSYKQFVKASMADGIFTALGEKYIIYQGEQLSSMVSIGYRDAAFKRGNRFVSGDTVCGPLSNSCKLLLSEVWTYDEDTDSNGNNSITPVFYGNFIKVDFPKIINDCIRIKRNTTGLSRALRPKTDKDQYLKLDSEEFEKYFDVYCNNKVLGMSLFTPDIMEKILYINNNYKTHNYYQTQFEATISNNSLYIAIPNRLDLFELDSKLRPKKDRVYQYYNYLKIILQIVYRWCVILDNFEE